MTAEKLSTSQEFERQLAALQRVSGVFGAMRKGQDIYDQITHQVVDLLNVEKCAVLLYDPDQQALVGQAPAVGVPTQDIRGYVIPLAEGSPARQFWEVGDSFVVKDIDADPVVQALGLTDFAHKVGVKSTMLVGMRLEGQLIGVIQPSNRRDGLPFDETDARLLTIYASQAAVAIENQRLYQAITAERDRLARVLATVQELSTPVVPVLEGILILPLIGFIDSDRAQRIMEGLLNGIVQYRAQVVILDVTGVPVVDTGVADHLVRAARAAGLLGAQPILVGIRPEVAQTIVGLGVHLHEIATRGDLRDGLEYALAVLHRKIVTAEGQQVGR
jgi:anti-anti-sigma regulatory factor